MVVVAAVHHDGGNDQDNVVAAENKRHGFDYDHTGVGGEYG